MNYKLEGRGDTVSPSNRSAQENSAARDIHNIHEDNCTTFSHKILVFMPAATYHVCLWGQSLTPSSCEHTARRTTSPNFISSYRCTVYKVESFILYPHPSKWALIPDILELETLLT